MKSIGEVFTSFISENADGCLIEKARGYAVFFSSWASILDDNRIPAAVSHSRIAEIERHIVQVEADHPGWVQILQTKQQELLEDLQRRFPTLEIRGIALRYVADSGQARHLKMAPSRQQSDPLIKTVLTENIQPEASPTKPPVSLEGIGDPEFVDSLKQLRQGIIERERKRTRSNRG